MKRDCASGLKIALKEKQTNANLIETEIKLAKINTIKDLKENLLNLESEYHQRKENLERGLKESIKALEEEQKKLEVDINKKVACMEDIKSELKRSKENKVAKELLDKKEKALEEAYKKFEKEKIDFEKNKIAEYTHITIPNQEYEVEEDKRLKSMIRTKNVASFQIYELIEDARSQITTNNIQKAKEDYAQIKSLYDHISIDTSEKKKLYYEVMELKTDIELAFLG